MKVFISYRRTDGRWQAGMIANAFKRRLPRENVFLDVDSIPLGADFVECLEESVAACDVFLCLIGKGWLASKEDNATERSLDSKYDFVRVEIRKALSDKKLVVPVFLDGAPTLSENQLPEDIRLLARRQAEFIEFSKFEADVQRLFEKLKIPERQSEKNSDNAEASEEETHWSNWEKLSGVWDNVTTRLEILVEITITDGRSRGRYSRISRKNYENLINALSNDDILDDDLVEALSEVNRLFLSWRSRSSRVPDDVAEKILQLWYDFEDRLPKFDNDEDSEAGSSCTIFFRIIVSVSCRPEIRNAAMQPPYWRLNRRAAADQISANSPRSPVAC